MKSFTVIWREDAEAELTRLWLENPQVRNDITAAADSIDHWLAIAPTTLGEPSSPTKRQYVQPPLKILFDYSEQDQWARVIYVKFWMD